MTTTFTLDAGFELPPAAVMSLIAQPETARARAELDPQTKTVVTEHSVTGSPEAPTAVLTGLSGRIPADWLGGRIGHPHFTREESWSVLGQGYGGTLTTVVSGLPVTCTADLALRPAGEGSELTAEVSLTVSVPIFGPSIERRVAEHLAAAMRTELAYLRQRCR